MNERAMVKSLLEYGLMEWNDTQKVVDYVFKEIEDNQLDELIDNKELVKVLQTYRKWYQQGLEPTAKSFLYYEDLAESALVVGLMDFKHELSLNWKTRFDIHVPFGEEQYLAEVFSSLNYLKLRKIKRLIDENQRDLEKEQNSEEQMVLLQTHQHLKQMEIELTKQLGTVIFR